MQSVEMVLAIKCSLFGVCDCYGALWMFKWKMKFCRLTPHGLLAIHAQFKFWWGKCREWQVFRRLNGQCSSSIYRKFGRFFKESVIDTLEVIQPISHWCQLPPRWDSWLSCKPAKSWDFPGLVHRQWHSTVLRIWGTPGRLLLLHMYPHLCLYSLHPSTVFLSAPFSLSSMEMLLSDCVWTLANISEWTRGHVKYERPKKEKVARAGGGLI